jgi:N-acetylglutamate synthase-like GNAT family acetyltransferase
VTLAPIEPASAAFEAFEQALQSAGLSTSDLLTEGGRYYGLRGPDDHNVAYGGLTPLFDEALLRSVVVPTASRGRSFDADAVARLTDLASTYHVRRLWLLTTDAEAFFARHGFVTVDRAQAPAPVAASHQFSDLCPQSAVLMCRTLA